MSSAAENRRGRRLLAALADDAPAFRQQAYEPSGGWLRRLLIALADAAPAFTPHGLQESYRHAPATDSGPALTEPSMESGSQTPSGPVSVSDQKAIDFANLFRRDFRIMTAFAMRMTPDRALAEDAVQEAFLKLYRRWDRLAVESAEYQRHYLFTLIRNEIVDWYRRDRIRPLEHLDAPGVLDEAVNKVESPQGLIELLELLNQLSERERYVLLSRAYGYSVRDIATAMGLTQGRVSQLLSHARQHLQEAIRFQESSGESIGRAVLSLLNE
jgi:RNA polymerase sigma-70 factor, ECF subfamily